MPKERLVLRSRVTLSSDELREIGVVAVESAYLEQAIEYAICRLCKVDEATYRALVPINALGSRINALKLAMSLHLPPGTKKRQEALINTLRKHADERNTVIHGRWGVPLLQGAPRVDKSVNWVRAGAPFVRRARKGVMTHGAITVDEMRAIAQHMARLQLQVLRLATSRSLEAPAESAPAA